MSICRDTHPGSNLNIQQIFSFVHGGNRCERDILNSSSPSPGKLLKKPSTERHKLSVVSVAATNRQFRETTNFSVSTPGWTCLHQIGFHSSNPMPVIQSPRLCRPHPLSLCLCLSVLHCGLTTFDDVNNSPHASGPLHNKVMEKKIVARDFIDPGYSMSW